MKYTLLFALASCQAPSAIIDTMQVQQGMNAASTSSETQYYQGLRVVGRPNSILIDANGKTEVRSGFDEIAIDPKPQLSVEEAEARAREAGVVDSPETELVIWPKYQFVPEHDGTGKAVGYRAKGGGLFIGV